MELSDWELKINMINMLRTLMEKVDTWRNRWVIKQRDKNPKKNQKEMLEIKNTIIQMKNVFDGLIRRPDTAEERISDLEHTSTETSQTRKKKE